MKEITPAIAQSDDGRFEVVIMPHVNEGTSIPPYVEAWVYGLDNGRRITTTKVVSVAISEINPNVKSPLDLFVATEQAKVLAAKKLILSIMK